MHAKTHQLGDYNGFDNTMECLSWEHASYGKATGFEQCAVFLLCAFTSARSHQHGEISRDGTYRGVGCRQDLLCYQQLRVCSHSSTASVKDGFAGGIVPIMQDMLQQIAICTGRNILKKAACDQLAALL